MLRRLVLFDIDGTLLKPAGVGRKSLNAAFTTRFGSADVFSDMPFHGRTDPDIIAEGVQRVGGTREDEGAMLASYLRHLDDEMRVRSGLVLPGVVDVLTALKREPGVMLGLVTGNVREGARIKLQSQGLADWFEVGAFGCDSTDRGELVRLARRRAAERGHHVEGPRAAFHIGDTQNDVLAARFGDAVAVAVATGGETFDQLAAHRPDHLFHSMEPAEAFVQALLA